MQFLLISQKAEGWPIRVGVCERCRNSSWRCEERSFLILKNAFYLTMVKIDRSRLKRVVTRNLLTLQIDYS